MSENDKKPDNPRYPKWLPYLLLILALVLWQKPWVSKDDMTDQTIPGTPTEQVQTADKPAEATIYSQFILDVRAGKITKVLLVPDGFGGTMITVFPKDGGKAYKVYSASDPKLMDELLAQEGLQVKAIPPAQPGFLAANASILVSVGILALFAYVFLFKKNGAGGMGDAGKFGKSKAKLSAETNVSVLLSDVEGADDAKLEVAEIVDFLIDPTKVSKLGGKIPRGALIVGPPGTGKTLLAKAIAGEARKRLHELAEKAKKTGIETQEKVISFFNVSGSEFVEMFVGVGASRIRDMFEQAKLHAPSVIFVDELDAIGRHRGAGNGGGNDEREQTLNQLLVEMDGFEDNAAQGVIVIAATNRPDILDKALLRPGRFDRQVNMGLPDLPGRIKILSIHMKKIVLGTDVRPEQIARGTPGFSGADLANLCNEAAIVASRKNKKAVEMIDFERAKDRIMAGAENSSCRMTEQEKDLTAYHEAGHMIVGRILESEGHDPVYKVTITPRGRSMGVTMFLPERDQVSLSYEKAQASMATGFGGRIAEEMFYGWKGVTTGASQDLAQVTDMATRMVTEWGWSPKCGPMTYTTASGAESYVGRGNVQRNTSNETAQMVDSEIRAFIDTNYKRAEEILKANRSKLIVTKDALRKWETIDRPQIDAIMEGKTLEEIPEPAWVSVVEAIADEVVATAKDTNPVDLTKPEGKQE